MTKNRNSKPQAKRQKLSGIHKTQILLDCTMAGVHKTQTLLKQMKSCSVILDSADVVRFYCGEAGRYRYYPQSEQIIETEPPSKIQYFEDLILSQFINIPVNCDKMNEVQTHPEQVPEEQPVTDEIPKEQIATEPIPEEEESMEVQESEETSDDDKKSIEDEIESPEYEVIRSAEDLKIAIRCLKGNTSEVKCVIEESVGAKNTNVQKFRCSKCNKTFSNIHFIKRHMKKSHNRISYCADCQCFFSNKTELVKHKCAAKKEKKKKSPYVCELCTETLKKRKDFKDHITMHIESFKPVDITTLNNIKYLARMKSMVQKKLHVHCNTCLTDVHYVEFFTRHVSQCCQNSNFICPLCSISKYHFPSMSEHLTRHLNFMYRNIACNSCNKLFLNVVNATTHSRNMHPQVVEKESYQEMLASRTLHFEPSTSENGHSPSKIKPSPTEVDESEPPVLLPTKHETTNNSPSKNDSMTQSPFKVATTIPSPTKSELANPSPTKSEPSSSQSPSQSGTPIKISQTKRRFRRRYAYSSTKKKSKKVPITSDKDNQKCISNQSDRNVQAESTINYCSIESDKDNEETDSTTTDIAILTNEKETKTESEIESDHSEKENKKINIEKAQTVTKQDPAMVKLNENIAELKRTLTVGLECRVICVPCKEHFNIETYLSHLPTCIPKQNFTCSFCSVKLTKNVNRRWLHLKHHLVLPNAETRCDLCDSTFLNLYNVSQHAQMEHFM